MSEDKVPQLRFKAGRYEENIVSIIRTVQVLLLLFFILMTLEMVFIRSEILSSILFYPITESSAEIENLAIQIVLYFLFIFSPLLLLYALDSLLEY